MARLKKILLNLISLLFSLGFALLVGEGLVNVFKVIYFMDFNDLFDNINTDINYRTHSYSRNAAWEMTLKKELVYSPNTFLNLT